MRLLLRRWHIAKTRDEFRVTVIAEVNVYLNGESIDSGMGASLPHLVSTGIGFHGGLALYRNRLNENRLHGFTFAAFDAAIGLTDEVYVGHGCCTLVAGSKTLEPARTVT